jgi:Uma2 family endonuclease
MQAVLEDLTCYLPVTLHKPGLSEAEWIQFCERYADFRLEYTSEGNLLIMPGTEPVTGRRNGDISRQLSAWSFSDATGEYFDSSTSFLQPSGARRSADAAWLTAAKYRQILDAQKPGVLFPQVVPDFIIELVSPSDRRRPTMEKMAEWIDAGVTLGWLIDPFNRTVDIFRADGSRETVLNPAVVKGEGPVEGFTLSMERIWDS